jgi:nucleotide-binding universal stress UspA family protein
VPDGILAYASEHDVDLIVMGTHGRRGVRRFLMGSVAEEVVRRSNCPVFTVHTADSGDEPMQSGDGADDQAGATAERGIRRMLVPIDFSDQTKPLLDHAREIARAYQTDVDLVHVVEPVSLPSAYGNAPVALNADDLKSGALSALDEQCEAFRDALGETAEGTIEVRGHLRMGHPAEEVLSLAEELDTDLIAIATHGRTGVKRLLMGSVSEKIVRMAPVPVFTVKSHGRSLVQSPRAASTAAES